MIAVVARWNPSLAELLLLLRCPATREPLELRDGSLRTLNGQRFYPVVDGVPILIARERSLFDPDDYQVSTEPLVRKPRLRRQAKQVARRVLASRPTLTRNLVADANLSRLIRELQLRHGAQRRCRVLVVGGASLGAGMDHVMHSPDVDVIETDVQLASNIIVVCDGHDLPFADGSFDGVICQAVLEHVLEPQRVANEIWRVLAPGGLVYSEVPFLWQVHAGAFDFTRFTHLGHRRMWRQFDEISSGADNGPGVALGLSLWYYVNSIAPRRLWPLTTRLVSLLFFWLKELDPWLVRKPAALDAAAGTFFLGSRRETPIGDREIVNGYRGANGPRPYLAIPGQAAD